MQKRTPPMYCHDTLHGVLLFEEDFVKSVKALQISDGRSHAQLTAASFPASSPLLTREDCCHKEEGNEDEEADGRLANRDA